MRLEAQQAADDAYAAQQGAVVTGLVVTALYAEVESGRKSDRPELAKALAYAKRSEAKLRSEAKRGAIAAAEAQRRQADAAYADLAPAVQELRPKGFSRAAIAAELNTMSHTTCRGKRWNHVQV